MLKVEQLSVSYGATEVVRGASFEVKPGSIVALLGGNGTGKTSIINALSGLVRAKSGRVLLDGADIAGRHPSVIVKAGMIQVPQGRFVWPGMTVNDNLVLGSLSRGARAGWQGDLDKVFALFPALRDKRGRRAGALSGGEQQMIAIGRAMMARPRMMLMDEPSAGLSPLMVEVMIEAISALRRDRMTILLVEQNIGVAAALAETAMVLSAGNIAFSAPGSSLVGNREVFDAYFGRH